MGQNLVWCPERLDLGRLLFNIFLCDISSLIRQKSESQDGCFKKTKHAKFSEKRTFLTPWYTHVRFEICSFALLPTIFLYSFCFFMMSGWVIQILHVTWTAIHLILQEKTLMKWFNYWKTTQLNFFNGFTATR